MKLKSETQAECEFCIDKYGELTCQFYKPRGPEFKVITKRNGKDIYCECCDYSEEEPDENENKDDIKETSNTHVPDELNVTDEIKTSAKGDNDGDNKEPAVKIQPGWYGKGYRKNYRKKKKNN